MPKRPVAFATAAAEPVAIWPRRRRIGNPRLAADMPEPAMSLPANVARGPAAITTNLCHGRFGEPCCFSASVAGARARYNDASQQCAWCAPALMESAMKSRSGRGNMARALRFFWLHNKEVYAKAVARVPAAWRLHWPLQVLGLSSAFHSAQALQAAMSTAQGRGRVLAALRKRQQTDPDLVTEAFRAIPPEHIDDLRAKLALEPRRQRQAAARARAGDIEQQWSRLLAQRRRLRNAAAPDTERTVYAARVAEDRARVRRKFFPARPREVRHTGREWSHVLTDQLAGRVRDVAANDTGLPRAEITPMAAMLEDWCKHGAWGICSQCYSLEPRHLKEVDTRRVAGPALPNCRWCRRDGTASVRSVKDVPRRLRGLTTEIVQALRPLDVDCGPYQRPLHGYRVHTALLRLLWSEASVESKIAELEPRAARKQAEKAFKFLMQSRDSEYAAFVEQHRRFLRANSEPSEADRRRPLQMLEAPGLETALWPDLYWDSNFCETVERATDARRLRRQGLLHEARNSEDEDEAADAEAGRGSLRRSFLKKVLGPILDYAGEYELLQFVFDLSLWSDLGSKRYAQPRVPLRILLKGAPFTPAYWAVRHAAVMDLQRQCGYPVLFKTWAPYEWSAPYHKALLRHMDALFRSRLHLEGPETLHLAHVLLELIREWVAGGSRKHGESSTLWRQHFLRGGGRVNFAARLEYQDGKRRAAGQAYHGRGAIHLHVVLFAENMQALRLHEKLLATKPPEGHPLRGYVMDQLSYSGSGWPVHEGASRWDDLDGVVRLHHTEDDAEQGVGRTVSRRSTC